jgi:hypothetical protein
VACQSRDRPLRNPLPIKIVGVCIQGDVQEILAKITQKYIQIPPSNTPSRALFIQPKASKRLASPYVIWLCINQCIKLSGCMTFQNTEKLSVFPNVRSFLKSKNPYKSKKNRDPLCSKEPRIGGGEGNRTTVSHVLLISTLNKPCHIFVVL